ncbi:MULTISPECIES: cobyrinate a,c-diamide synthase [Nocardia]|uniref:Hydrogenobyrinate a,c-diamide synthase n=2 Tax=Nocardia TaxID=1817 RepID=A0A2T2YZY9_9NOCA|nr:MULTISPECIES: cobyrinate a,c-diamide synthase [Nocardia]MBF6450159.1 cobyrinate a,c-diamide synthase [Nocardia elegans]PSR61087.1 cobyrinate a,c-diamide synthase [Nocardia nova]
MTTPAVVIAAPASGSGKTTLATGLIGALRRAGHRVAPFKVGPDYIDPGYHGLAAGRPGRNLDPVLVGAERVVPLYRHGSAGCDVAVVEGVMGLFDGRIDAENPAPIAEGSTAQVAALLGAPVLLVVDARGHSQSLAALLHGFATYDSGIRLGGVILNRVGSPRHEQVLRGACARVGLPVLGALPRMDELSVPARHLGLVPAVEHGSAAHTAVEAMTELVGAHIDVGAVARLAAADVNGPAWDPIGEVAAAAPHLQWRGPGVSRTALDGPEPGEDPGPAGAALLLDSTAPTVGRSDSSAPAIGTSRISAETAGQQQSGEPETPIPMSASGSGVREPAPIIAMAGGPAFTFGYAEHRELLMAAGARVAVFDPLHEQLPPGTAGLVLPGGFPEEHAADLAANTPLLTAVAEAAARGMPIHAECAGLLYLTRSLDGHRMAGVLDATAEFGPRLTLGYRDAVALADSVLWRAGERVRGHEFHRTRLVSTGSHPPAWGWRTDDAAVREGAVARQVHASYLHTHPAGNPTATVRFVAMCEQFATAHAGV